MSETRTVGEDAPEGVLGSSQRRLHDLIHGVRGERAGEDAIEPVQEEAPDFSLDVRNPTEGRMRRFAVITALTLTAAGSVLLFRPAAHVPGNRHSGSADAMQAGAVRDAVLRGEIAAARYVRTLPTAEAAAARVGVREAVLSLDAALAGRGALRLEVLQAATTWAVQSNDMDLLERVAVITRSVPDWERYSAGNEIMREVALAAARVSARRLSGATGRRYLAEAALWEKGRLAGRALPAPEIDPSLLGMIRSSTSVALNASRYRGGEAVAYAKAVRLVTEGFTAGLALHAAPEEVLLN